MSSQRDSDSESEAAQDEPPGLVVRLPDNVEVIRFVFAFMGLFKM
jgi:hypothetical protein